VVVECDIVGRCIVGSLVLRISDCKRETMNAAITTANLTRSRSGDGSSPEFEARGSDLQWWFQLLDNRSKRRTDHKDARTNTRISHAVEKDREKEKERQKEKRTSETHIKIIGICRELSSKSIDLLDPGPDAKALPASSDLVFSAVDCFGDLLIREPHLLGL
jgi:hypothetical protein